MNLKKMILSNIYIPFSIEVAKDLGQIEAIALSELINQYQFYSENNMLVNGFFYCTREFFEDKTSLTRHQQDLVFKNLTIAGLIETKLIGLPAKKHFKVLEENIIVYFNDLFSKQVCRKPTNSLPETDKHCCHKEPNNVAENLQQIRDKNKIKEKEVNDKEVFSENKFSQPTDFEKVFLELSKKIESLEGGLLELKVENDKLKEEANKKPSKGRADALNKSVIKKKTPTEILLALKPEGWEPDNELLELWEIINAEKTWKDKSEHTLTLRVKDLLRFDPEFSKELLKQAIKGGAKGVWQGFVFKETPERYEQWKWAKNHGGTPAAAPKKENPRNDFAKYYK